MEENAFREKSFACHAEAIMHRAGISRGPDFFYGIAMGLDDAMRDGKLPKISAIEKLATSYDAKWMSLEPSRPGRRAA